MKSLIIIIYKFKFFFLSNRNDIESGLELLSKLNTIWELHRDKIIETLKYLIQLLN